jgi:hypothetical protein
LGAVGVDSDSKFIFDVSFSGGFLLNSI